MSPLSLNLADNDITHEPQADFPSNVSMPHR